MTAPSVWPGIEVLVRAGDTADLVAALVRLDDAGRTACVRPLRALSRSGDFGTPFELVNPLAVAGAAILPDARSVAAWLRRFTPMDTWHVGRTDRAAEVTTRAVIEVLVQRDPGWLPALVDQLVERLGTERPGSSAPLYEVVEALRAHRDLPPPATSAYAAQWVLRDWPTWVARGTSGPPGHEAEFRAVLPLAVDEPGTAGWLAEEPWRSHLSTALARGDVDRLALLDACLARLQRGGRPVDTQAVVALHDVLSPTLDEVSERRRDYLALLPPGSTSPVVVAAQRELRRLHDGGLLTGAELLEQSRSVLVRTEKKVVRDHLALLAAHAAEVPADVDVVVEGAATAFANAAADIQRAGVDLVATHVARASPRTRDAVLGAAPLLPRDLEERLLARAGIDRPPVRRAPAPVPALTAPVPVVVTPIADLDAAVAELLALVRREANDHAAIDVERVVEALPRFAARDRDALHRATASLVDPPWYEGRTVWGMGTMLELLAAACTGRARPTEVDGRIAAYDPVPDRVIQLRVADLAAAVRAHPGTLSVALPSTDDGVISGEALLARLTGAARDGWSPSPLDLELALLRLDLDGVAPEPFEDLGTAAGAQAAAWLRGSGADVPVVRAVRGLQWEGPRQSHGWGDEPAPPPHVWVAEVVPGDGPAGTLWSLLRSWVPDPRGIPVLPGWGSAFDLWAWVAPHHRDVVAAHLTRTLPRALTDPSRAGDALVPLAHAHGPVGDGMLVATCSAMGARHPQTRAAAVDALLVLAARGDLDGARLGRRLGSMVTAGDLVTARLVAPLVQAAAAGAAAQVWATVAGLLAVALPHDRTVAGLAQLLSAAVDIAEDHRFTGTIDGLDAMAERKGRSQQVVEARRLRDVLARHAT